MENLNKENEMNKLIETSKEIDRILKSGIKILPNSPIHEKLKQALM